MRERIFAGAGAVLFLGSACAVTVFALMQGGDKPSTDTQSSQQACTDSQTEPTLAVPEIYKSDGAVTQLQKTDLQQGSGASAKDGDCLVMKYYGTLASDGTKFDENFTDTTAFAFKLGQGQVISGWDQGLAGMKVGSVRRLVIPAALGYGNQGQGSIPPNADLVFVVKLLRIQK
ncbi:MAG TPA: FKBP-type peptidyl-prolyl cis-trans isomerase [Candidatus Saccharimonadales bacterium]|nr:FKBP-type peptidyl-prolyl cis-trans isomerase [Candidatus Saccharimonadales bacterium]